MHLNIAPESHLAVRTEALDAGERQSGRHIEGHFHRHRQTPTRSPSLPPRPSLDAQPTYGPTLNPSDSAFPIGLRAVGTSLAFKYFYETLLALSTHLFDSTSFRRTSYPSTACNPLHATGRHRPRCFETRCTVGTAVPDADQRPIDCCHSLPTHSRNSILIHLRR